MKKQSTTNRLVAQWDNEGKLTVAFVDNAYEKDVSHTEDEIPHKKDWRPKEILCPIDRGKIMRSLGRSCIQGHVWGD
jgi:hypothetical protein